MYEGARRGPIGGRLNEAGAKDSDEVSSPSKVESKPRFISGFVPGGMNAGLGERPSSTRRPSSSASTPDTWGVDDGPRTLPYGDRPNSEDGFVDLRISAQPGSMEIRGGMHPPAEGLDESESSK